MAHHYLIPVIDNTSRKRNLYSLHEEITISYRKGLQFSFQAGDCVLLTQQSKKTILPYEFQIIKVNPVQRALLLKVKKIHKLPISFSKAMYLLATPSNITDYRFLTEDEFASLISLMYDDENVAFAATTLSSPLVWEEFPANSIHSPLEAVGASQTEDYPITPLQVYFKNTGTPQIEDSLLAPVQAYPKSTGVPHSQDRWFTPRPIYPSSTNAHQTENHPPAPVPAHLNSMNAHQAESYPLASVPAPLTSMNAHQAESYPPAPVPAPRNSMNTHQTENHPPAPVPAPRNSMNTHQTENHPPAPVPAPRNSMNAHQAESYPPTPVPAPRNSMNTHQTENHPPTPVPAPRNSMNAHQTENHPPTPVPAPRNSMNAHQTENHLLATVQAYLKSKGYYFEEETIKNYHICLKTKPFVILAGLSGTGKSKLAKLYAEALGSRNFFQRIPVEPNWADSHDLLGHFNALTGEYETKPALDFLLKSAQDPDHLYFVCLDEMNLSHIEYYFAPFLSAMEEDQTEDRTVPLMSKNVYTRLQKEKRVDESVPFEITIPKQFYFIGTINIDETTRPLSDKVIDRANTIEFFDVHLDQLPTPHTPPSLQLISAQNWEHFKAKFPDLRYRPYLKEIDNILHQANFGLGYRIVREIEMYIANSKDLLDPLVAFDLQVKQRILPRIRGTDTPLLSSMIDELSSFMHKHRLVRTEKRLDEMKSRLKRDGYTSFWR